MIGIDVTGRRPDDIDRIVGERQGGAGVLFQRIECELSVGGACSHAGHRCADELWSAELFDAGRNGKCMQMLKVFICADGMADLGPGEDVECAGFEVNDGCGSDSDFGPDEKTLNVVL